MEINKAHWSMESDHIRLSMPINKIDKERRIVTGFATLDNLDRQGDVVPKEASVKAFENFRGNIREMHQPIAVGKVVSFKEDTYFDQGSKKFYNGIVVSAYVSKGAQDTWEKVLDGTLTGFSIGGSIDESEDIYDEDLGKSYRVIKDYSLTELSLVDNPANQFANVFSIEKGVASGYLSKTSTENVFWCRKCDVVKMSSDSSCSCPQCDSSMMNIGFVESNDTEKSLVVKSMVEEIKGQEILKGIKIGTFVKYNDAYGKISQIVFHGGARLSNDEVVLVAKSDDPIAIIKVYSQNNGTIVPTNRRVIKNISSLEKVNAISKSEVKEVSKMDSEIIVVDEIEKSMSETAIEPTEQDAIPTSVDDATPSDVVGKAQGTDEAETAEEDASETQADEDAEAKKAMGTEDEKESPEEAATETSADEEAEAKKAATPGFDEGYDDQLDPIKAQVAEIGKTLESALSSLAETVKALDAKIEGINKSVTGVANEVNEVKDSFGKRVDAVEKDTAFRKSADLGEILQEEPVIMEKSTWGGRFLNNADLFN